jgi:hypothetical protein
MFENLNEETRESLMSLVFIRLSAAKIDRKASKYFDKIKKTDGEQEDAVLDYSCSIQEHSYLAGLKDGARLMTGLGVTVNE